MVGGVPCVYVIVEGLVREARNGEDESAREHVGAAANESADSSASNAPRDTAGVNAVFR